MIFQTIVTIICLLLFVSGGTSLLMNRLSKESSSESRVNKSDRIIEELSTEIDKINSESLNCFGIPVRLFANAVENLLTQETRAEDVRFYFYSRGFAGNVTVRNHEEFDVLNLPYNSSRKTVIITHGFMSSGTVDWIQALKDAFLKFEDVNVIAVDWQKGSNTWNYVSASISTKIVGAEIAKLLSLVKAKTLAASDGSAQAKQFAFGSLYFIGHSLGSHISAHASYVLKELQLNDTIKFTIARITGLDPAQPCFRTADDSLKLDPTDAEYVDVIHTNARNILLLGLGLPEQLGNADYYPNGGKIQLGCANIDAKFWDFLLLPINIVKSAICSHGRSHQLLTDSIHTAISAECRFVGHTWNQKYENLTSLTRTSCDEEICPEMGINSINYHPDKDGIYFVPTSANAHYCDISKDDMENARKQLRRENNNFIGKFVDAIA